MQWQEHDWKNLLFHAAIAEECKGQDGAVMEFVKDKEQHFKTRFDNVTIFVETGKTQHGYREWKTHKRFDFSWYEKGSFILVFNFASVVQWQNATPACRQAGSQAPLQKKKREITLRA